MEIGQRSEQIEKLSAALVAFSSEELKIPKRGMNKHIGYAYALLDDIIYVCKPILGAHGLAIIQLASNDELNPAVTTMLIHQSGQYVCGTVKIQSDVHKSRNSCQAFGSALTYAKKYGYCAILGIIDQPDDDGQGSSASPAADKVYGGSDEEQQRIAPWLKSQGIDPKYYEMIHKALIGKSKSQFKAVIKGVLDENA